MSWLDVLADSLLRQLFYNLIDDSLKHGEKVSQIRVYYESGKDQLKLVYEDDVALANSKAPSMLSGDPHLLQNFDLGVFSVSHL